MGSDETLVLVSTLSWLGQFSCQLDCKLTFCYSTLCVAVYRSQWRQDNKKFAMCRSLELYLVWEKTLQKVNDDLKATTKRQRRRRGRWTRLRRSQMTASPCCLMHPNVLSKMPHKAGSCASVARYTLAEVSVRECPSTMLLFLCCSLFLCDHLADTTGV